MKSYIQYKFNIDFLKYLGFVLATPICSILFNILVMNHSFFTLLSIRALISFLACIAGVQCILRAREIGVKIDARINRNYKQK